MKNERTLTATNKILVGSELIEEYLFDETKKPELEKGLKNLVNELYEMIEDEDTNLSTIYNGSGRTILLDSDAVYDMIDDMYLSLPWEAPRWGKATDRSSKCFAYGKEKEILAREVALKLGAYNDVVLLNLGTNDIKRVSFEDWYALPVEQRDEIILETDHDFIYADNIFIPDEIIEAEDVYDFDSLFCNYCEQLEFDLENLSLNAEITCDLSFTENGEVETIKVIKDNKEDVKKVSDIIKKAAKLIDMNLHKVDEGGLLKSFGDAHHSLIKEFKQMFESEKFLNFARSKETILQDGQLKIEKVDGLYKFNFNDCIEECMTLFFSRKIHFKIITFDLYDSLTGQTIYNILALQVALNLFEIGFLY